MRHSAVGGRVRARATKLCGACRNKGRPQSKLSPPGSPSLWEMAQQLDESAQSSRRPHHPFGFCSSANKKKKKIFFFPFFASLWSNTRICRANRVAKGMKKRCCWGLEGGSGVVFLPLPRIFSGSVCSTRG